MLRGADFMEFTSAIDKYRLRTTGQSYSSVTLRNKRNELLRAAHQAGCESPQDLAELLTDRERCEALVEALRSEVSGGSARLVVQTLIQFGTWAQDEGLVDAPPQLERADVPPANPQAPVVIYTPEERERILTGAKAQDGTWRWYGYLAFLAHTGRRASEALSVRYDWLHLNAHPPYVELPTSKNHRQQYVPLNSVLQAEVFTPEHIAAWRLNQRDYRTRSVRDYPWPWTYRSVLRRFSGLCEAVGIEPRGLHAFRHAKATELLVSGAPPQAVASLLGNTVGVLLARYHHATALQYADYME